MRKSLRDRLLSRIEDMQKRVIQLKKNSLEYAEEGRYVDAMKNDIKYQQLRLVVQELNKLID